MAATANAVNGRSGNLGPPRRWRGPTWKSNPQIYPPPEVEKTSCSAGVVTSRPFNRRATPRLDPGFHLGDPLLTSLSGWSAYEAL